MNAIRGDGEVLAGDAALLAGPDVQQADVVRAGLAGPPVEVDDLAFAQPLGRHGAPARFQDRRTRLRRRAHGWEEQGRDKECPGRDVLVYWR